MGNPNGHGTHCLGVEEIPLASQEPLPDLPLGLPFPGPPLPSASLLLASPTDPRLKQEAPREPTAQAMALHPQHPGQRVPITSNAHSPGNGEGVGDAQLSGHRAEGSHGHLII